MTLSDLNIRVDRDRCLACGTCVDRCIMDNLRLSVGPCRQACPLEINCQGYARLLAQGRDEEAAVELRKHTPFGGILSRVCHRPCEAACERQTHCRDGGVRLRALKRYLAGAYPAIVGSPTPTGASSGKKTAVVGSGPAGLMAAHELAAAGHSVTLLEARDRAGGLLRYGIPAFRLPGAVLDAALRQLTDMGVCLKTGVRLGTGLTLEDLCSQNDAVLLAPGLGAASPLPVPGADLPGVRSALEVLAALREGETFAGLVSAVVVGGGSTALDAALSLKKAGAREVTLLALEAPHEMPVPMEEKIEAAEQGVRIRNRRAVLEIRKEQGEFHLDLQRCLAVFDQNGRFAPELDNAAPESLSAGMVVVAVGQRLDPTLTDLPLSRSRLLDGDPQTCRLAGWENVFVAGDCADGSSSVVNAMASGKKAAACLNRFLDGCFPLCVDEWAENGRVREYESDLSRSDKIPAGSPEKRPLAERTLRAEVELPLSPERARREASRCLSCGRAFEANQSCWFCLPCEIDCPEKAITVRIPYLVR